MAMQQTQPPARPPRERSWRAFTLRDAVAKLEDEIIVLSGPALAISGILAGLDLLTGGNALKFGPFGLIWAICLLLTLDFQVLALGFRSHAVYSNSDKSARRKSGEIALAVVIAAAVSYVSIQMQSVVAQMNYGRGMSVDVAAGTLGVNLVALTWERSILVLVLIFMSGWLRDGHGVSSGASTPSTVNSQVSTPSQPQGMTPEQVHMLLSDLSREWQQQQTAMLTRLEEVSAKRLELALIRVEQLSISVQAATDPSLRSIESSPRRPLLSSSTGQGEQTPEQRAAEVFMFDPMQFYVAESGTSVQGVQFTEYGGRDDVQETAPSVHSGHHVSSASVQVVSTVDEPVDTERRIRALLAQDPTLSGRQMASKIGCSPTTANTWKKRIEAECPGMDR